MELSSRIVGVKRRGSRELVGVVVYVDRDVLLLLEDLASVYGCVDDAVSVAVKELHGRLFGGEEVSVSGGDDRIERLIRLLEEKLVSIVPVSRSSGGASVSSGVELPELVEVGESGGEDVVDLEDVLDSVMVVEVDESELKGRKEESSKEDVDEE